MRRNLPYTVTAGVCATSPKNGKVRVVDVGPETLALLKYLREKQAETCLSKWCFTQEGALEPMRP